MTHNRDKMTRRMREPARNQYTAVMAENMLLKEEQKACRETVEAREDRKRARQGMTAQNMGTHLSTTEPVLTSVVKMAAVRRGKGKAN